MTYEEACAYLGGLVTEVRSSAGAPLARMRALLAALGDPHLAYPTIQVGGTSGKGSTATMIAAVLQSAGKKTALHVKPHLREPTERARIDGEPVSRERFAELVARIRRAADGMRSAHGVPTYYEATLATALLHFAVEKVDVAIVEVGIGGTFDGTNVLAPVVCVITNVGLDHMEILGDTLEAIARDKAGIAKSGVPLVSDVAPGGARAQIALRCASVGAPLILVSQHARVDYERTQPAGQRLHVTTARTTYALVLPLFGEMQRRNAATAILALEALPAALRPEPAAVVAGLALVEVPGRMDVRASDPLVVFDIAHNPEKATALAAALTETFPDRRFVFVVAISQTKDASGVLAPLLPLARRIICTRLGEVARDFVSPGRLAAIAVRAGVHASVIADPHAAFGAARPAAGPGGIVVVTGSTFLVGALR